MLPRLNEPNSHETWLPGFEIHPVIDKFKKQKKKIVLQAVTRTFVKSNVRYVTILV